MKLNKWPKSLPSYLTRWQIGLPLHRHELDESPRFCTNVIRHILKGRATSFTTANNPSEATVFDPDLDFTLIVNISFGHTASTNANTKRRKHSHQRRRRKWSRLNFSHQNEFLNQYIVIKRDIRTHFYTPGQGHATSSPLTCRPFRLKFSLESWRSYDVWHVKPAVPVMVGSNLLKVPTTLVLLRKDGRSLVLHCMETGRKLEELALDQEFDDVIVHDEENLIYVTSSCTGEYLGFSYPPLKFLYRVIIPWGYWIGFNQFERLGGLALASRRNQVEFYDYQELIEMNTTPSGGGGEGVFWADGRTIALKHKPEPLTRLESKDNYLVLLPSLPPKVIVQRKKGVEEIYSLDRKEPIFRVASELPLAELGMIRCYDEQKQRIFVHGLLHGFDVMDFCESENTYRIIFTTKDILSNYEFGTKKDEPGPGPAPEFANGRRQGLRNRKRTISYDEIDSSSAEQRWGAGYDDSSDLVACCLFKDGVLWSTILDNNTPNLALFCKLDPVKISVPEIPDNSLACSSISVHFYEWFISVRMKLYDLNSSSTCEQLYVLSVLEEDVEVD